jgi:hypothetical protein
MRIERIYLLLFSVSMLVALIYVANETVPGWKAALIIGGQGLMFLMLGFRTKSQVEHQRNFRG